MAQQQVEAEVGGTVCRIECAVGSSLVEGDAIIVVESMKMEVPLAAPADARLLTLFVAVGDIVAEGQAVAMIEIT